MSDRPIRVAFIMIPRRKWAGGYNYLVNLCEALHQHCRGAITPVVFAGLADDAADVEGIARIEDVEVLRSAAFDPSRAGLPQALLLGLDRAVAAEFRAKGIDVVLENARFFGWRLPQASVAWLPDLQHRRLPNLFSLAGWWHREIGFRMQIAAGRLVMLSSDSALHDCETFYPAIRGRASVVKFAVQPPPDLLRADPADVISHYRLPASYFYLPNQFWRHKNHGVVIEALAILAKRGDDVVIAASGSNSDPREPGYFDAIMRQVAAHGLANNFRYVGMIPLSHVYALLRGATALINPSRFEGWSTTIEEAKAFGVPTVLSDLDVHREQTGGTALYFPTDDAQTLAEQLATAAQAGPPASVRNLLPDLDRRVAEFARGFVATVRQALQNGRN
jgi:glycosyltransferase involved in cell wall biosynthesis